MIELNDLPEIPENWSWVRITDIADIVTGNTPPKKDSSNYGEYIPLVKPPELIDEKISKASDYLSKKGAELGRVLSPKSILVSCIGNLGKTGFNTIPVAFNQQINAVMLNHLVIPEYGFYFFQTHLIKKWLKKLASATTISIVNKSKFQTIFFPLAPIEEQKRIVEKIEELFSRIDTSAEDLLNIRRNLDAYRKSILLNAFNGKLVDTNSEWIKCNLIDACEKITDGSHYTPKYYQSGYPFITIKNRINNKIDFDSAKLISNEDFHKLKRNDCNPKKGDILFSKDGTVGEVIKIDYDKDFIVLSSWAIIRPKKEVTQDYLYYFLNSPSVVNEASKLKTGTAIRRIILRNLKLVNFKYPTNIFEQEKIAKEIELYLSVIDKIEETIIDSLSKKDQLRTSILKNAFSGKLIPQDPNDEPAEELLKKIKQEKLRLT